MYMQLQLSLSWGAGLRDVEFCRHLWQRDISLIRNVSRHTKRFCAGDKDTSEMGNNNRCCQMILGCICTDALLCNMLSLHLNPCHVHTCRSAQHATEFQGVCETGLLILVPRVLRCSEGS